MLSGSFARFGLVLVRRRFFLRCPGPHCLSADRRSPVEAMRSVVDFLLSGCERAVGSVASLEPKRYIGRSEVSIEKVHCQYLGCTFLALIGILIDRILYACTVDEVLMAKNQKQQAYEVTPTDRLGMRVSAMINSPKAQELGKVTIHRLYSDPAEAWDAVMEALVDADGIDLEFNDDGTVTLRWEAY